MLTLPCGCVVGCRVLMLPFVAGIGVAVAVGMLIHLLVSLARDAREETDQRFRDLDERLKTLERLGRRREAKE